MTSNIEDALQRLRNPLQQRLNAVIDHLRAAPWPDPDALCFAGNASDSRIVPPGHWGVVNRNEVDQMRYDAYTWSLRQLEQSRMLPLSISSAIARIEESTANLVDTAVDMIGACVTELVAKEYRSAVLNRGRLVRDWTWPLEATNGGAFLHLLVSLCPTLPPNEKLIAAWPPDAAISDVANWAHDWLEKNAYPGTNENVADLMKQTQRATPMVFDLRLGTPYGQMATPSLALLYLLEREVKENQQRKYIALDTCKEHTKLVEGWRDLPKSKATSHRTPLKNGRLELILPDEKEKRHFQLSLAFDEQPLATQIAEVLREWRSWAGLRHWATFQSQITNNNRLGWVRWTVDEHLKAMGYCEERRRRLEVRRDAAEMITLFTKIELGVYDEKGNIRERRPLLLKMSTFERLQGSQWEIEGLALQINPLLYRGVRDLDTGDLGKNWWPTTNELPLIDHHNYGPAIALGTVLPARWRMELARSSRPYVDLKGDSLLRAAGLPYKQRNAVATWRAVASNLAELQRRRGLERWEWLGEPDLSTVCRLYAPQWAVDRIAHGVPPKELKPAPTALNGSELKVWRKKENLTQAEAATRLGVGIRTLTRAEFKPDKPLTKKLRDALASQIG